MEEAGGEHRKQGCCFFLGLLKKFLLLSLFDLKLSVSQWILERELTLLLSIFWSKAQAMDFPTEDVQRSYYYAEGVRYSQVHCPQTILTPANGLRRISSPITGRAGMASRSAVSCRRAPW